MKQQNKLEYLKPWLTFKIIEFVKEGYDSISVSDLEKYVYTFLWKRKMPQTQFEQIYAINQITINDYFDFVALEAQVYQQTSLQDLDLSELF